MSASGRPSKQAYAFSSWSPAGSGSESSWSYRPASYRSGWMRCGRSSGSNSERSRTRRRAIERRRVLDRSEFEPELLPHLIQPLRYEAGRYDQEDSLPDPAGDQLEKAYACFDGLPEADIVGDQ